MTIPGFNTDSEEKEHEMSYNAQWNEKLNALIASGMPRQRAVLTLARRDPELRERMLMEANASNPHALNAIAGQHAVRTGARP